MATYVLFHDDSDGYASALAAYLKLGDEAKYLKVQYGQKFPDIPLSKETDIYIVDFSYDKDILEAVMEQVHFLIVIDHHDTAYQQLIDFPNKIYDQTKSGAVLTWEYFHPQSPVPDLFLIVEDRDLWKFNREDSHAFEHGMKSSGRYNDLKFWKEVYESPELLQEIISRGTIQYESIVKYINSVVKDPSKYKLCTYRGLKCVIYNAVQYISELGNAFNERLDIDFSISYFFTNDGLIVFSLRGKDKKHHLGELCLAMNSVVIQGEEVPVMKIKGGGHENAAGVKFDLENGFKVLKSFYSQES